MSLNQHEENDSLKRVLIIFRHGYRTSLGMCDYPDDPNKDFVEPGVAQLTKEGRQQMYKLGEHLHRRYEKLINFNPRSIYARSSCVNRCLESSGCFLASFCPPKDYYYWNPALNWQPIPINSVPRETDGVLYPKDAKAVAGRFARATTKKELQDELKRIECATGVSSENQINFFYLVEGLVCQMDHKLLVDPKVENCLQDVYDILDFYYEEFLGRTYDIVNCGGGLFDDIYRLLQGFITADGKIKDDPIKCYAYCTSDVVLIALLEILGIWNQTRMDLGSTLIFELHEIDGAPCLKILYNRNVSKDFDNFPELHLKNCGRYCTIQDYREAGQLYLDNNKPADF